MRLFTATQPHNGTTLIEAANSISNSPLPELIIALVVVVAMIKIVIGSNRSSTSSGNKNYRATNDLSRNDLPAPKISAPTPRPQYSLEPPPPISPAAKARGERAEIVVRDELALELPPDIYHVFHDILIPTPEGKLTQIDHVVVSAFGVFVIETKHIGGWIFGKVDDARWTIQFPDGKRDERQNPLEQNKGHIRALARLVHAPELYFCNLVRLTGKNELMSGPIPGVMKDGMTNFIKYFQNPLFTLEDVRRMYRTIMMADKSKCSFAKEEHLNSVQRKARRRIPAGKA